MDGRQLLGIGLIVAGCVPADDLKDYSEGSASSGGTEPTTVINASTTTDPDVAPAVPMSAAAGVGSSASDDGEVPVDPVLDPAASEAPTDAAGGSAPPSEPSAASPPGAGMDAPTSSDPMGAPPASTEGAPPPAGGEDNSAATPPSDADAVATDGDGDIPEPPAAVLPGVPPRFRFVRLVADSAVLGPYTSIAEFNVLDGDGGLIDRSSWSASADSEETIYVGGAGAHYAIDGQSITIWHTAWFGVDPPPAHPHTLEIDMGESHAVAGFRYLGRQDESLDGRLGAYRFFVSVDGQEWGEPVVAGTLANSVEEQEVLLP